MSQLRFIRSVIYRLKTRYPGAIDIVRRTANSVDTSTGIKTVVLRGVHVNRAIALPSDISRAALFDRTYVASDRDFVYGTNFDVTVRTFIIDRLDLPSDFEPQMGDYIVHLGVRYNVQKIKRFEDDAAFICLCKETLSEPPNLSLDINVYDDLGIISDMASLDLNFSPLEVHVGDSIIFFDLALTNFNNFASSTLTMNDRVQVEVFSNSDDDSLISKNGSLFTQFIGTPVYNSGSNVFLPGRANDITAVNIIGLISDPSILPSASGLVKLDGILTATTGQWDFITGQIGGLSPGVVYYLDPNTAGKITSSVPTMAGQFIVQLGIAIDSTNFDVDIKAPIGL